ncbi:selenium cofactor biosynthesis protein YqeC [Veillonella criceti]|uniref:Putative selenium-dependent hydroxylase accessory protein YqeC n=1 Tax=Veillonella criceti TaxID=103891 RepID=A0A380NKS7_9FIRM|nr:selenium cofactor biosynthesis protein YqeC [Veillonella criceti]SUP43499.1 putative selenium-dependent hydroxylase accessory protein YqeC [Veillonella criceti]
MTMQAKHWSSLIQPGITAIVGAGGKTTVLAKLVEYGGLEGQPTLVTTTTKLYESQVALWNPYYGTDFNEAEEACHKAMHRGRCAAWFSGVDGTKVTSLPAKAIDEMHMVHPKWQILVEADGAKEKWLKAPKNSEPVIPTQTNTTIGVVNLQMLGTQLTPEHVHNIEEVSAIMERPEGAVVTPSMLARLVLHPQGLFQYSRGRRILFCTGYDTVQHRIIDDFLDRLADSKLAMIVLADGYKASCEIARVLRWQ